MRKPEILTLGTILLLGALYLTTLRPGQEWGDDFSLYVAHARNLAEGRPYADTGYLYNPDNPVLSPRTYPPVFPLLLVPVYLAFGMNLTAMKAWVVLLFLGFLGTFALLLRRRLPLPHTLVCLLLVGLNPYLWQLKDRLLSEMPFLLFAYLALLLMERAREAQEVGARAWTWGALAGLAAYLAFGTRTVGVVLVPALLGAELLARRRLGAASLAALAAFAAGAAVEKALLPADASYLDQLDFSPALVLRVAVSLVKALGTFFENGYSDAFRLALFAGLLGLALFAYLRRLRSRPGPCELFAGLSLLLLVFWPYAEWNERYLVPVLPLFFLYAAEALRGLESATGRRLAGCAAAAVGLLVLGSYAACYTRLDAGPVREGVAHPDSVALFEFVRAHTPRDAVVVFQKPRALALYTGRRASAFNIRAGAQHFQEHIDRIRATYLVLGEDFPESVRALREFVRRRPGHVERVYDNPHFTVYRLGEPPLAAHHPGRSP
jgi:hypothetical protein